MGPQICHHSTLRPTWPWDSPSLLVPGTLTSCKLGTGSGGHCLTQSKATHGLPWSSPGHMTGTRQGHTAGSAAPAVCSAPPALQGSGPASLALGGILGMQGVVASGSRHSRMVSGAT